MTVHIINDISDGKINFKLHFGMYAAKQAFEEPPIFGRTEKETCRSCRYGLLVFQMCRTKRISSRD